MLQRSHPSTDSSGLFSVPVSGVSVPKNRLGIRVARIASAIVVAIGVLVLIGWGLDIDLLRSVSPGLVTMKVNTAVCFILAGISLRLQTDRFLSPLKSRMANGCAIGIALIAFGTICEYLFGWNLGIDELLFRDLNTVGTVAPGRMGINTAVNFCLTGVALWLINCPERRSSSQPQHRVKIDRIAIAQIMTVVAALIALQAIFSYVYDVPLSTMTTSMALHTTIAFEGLCAGILGLRSDRGFMRSLTTDLVGGNVARRFMPTAIVIPLVVGWLVFQGLKAKLYDPNVALSLMSLSMVAIWLGQIRINAGTLNRIDYDRIRSDDRIRSSEERLKLALQGARQGTWELDVRTQTLSWDEGCKAIFGLSPTAVVTFTEALDILHPEDRERVVDGLTIATREGGVFVQEYRTIHADRAVRWVLAQGRCYCDPNGEPSRMLGTMMDITDRKQRELNEQFLNSLTRRLRQIADPDEMQLEVVRSLGEYLNVDRATWCKVDWKQRLVTIDREWHRDGLDSHAGVYALGDFLPPELQVALFAGESVVVADVSAEPLIAPNLGIYQQLGMGAIAKFPCIFEERWVATLNVNTQQVRSWRNDEVALMQAIVAQLWSLIEQTRSARALRAEEERTRAAQAIVEQQLGEIEAIYRSAPIGLSYINSDLRFIRINEQLAQINGLPISEHLGRTIREVLPEMADTIEPLYRQVIESGEPIFDLEVSGITASQPGANRYWLASYHPHKDAQSRVVGVSAVVKEITDRKREEAQLQQAEATIRQQLREIEAIYRSAPVGLCFVDTDLRYVRINERLAQINGSSVVAHIGNTLRELLPELADEIEPIYRQVIESGQPIVDLEVSGINPAHPGVLRSWISSFYPQTDAAARTIGVNTVVQEITDRKRQEAERERTVAALRESEQKFSAIFNNTFGLIGLFSLDGTVLEVNRSALDSIAGQPSDIIGKKCWETPWWTHSPQLQHQLKESISQAASGQFVRYEVEFPNPQGGMTTTDFSLTPVFDETNRVVTIVAEGRDITNLKQAEAELREGEQRFHTLADNISQFAWMANADGWIFWYNRRWFEYTGTTLEQMQGWGWQQVHHPDHLDRVVKHFRHHIEAGQAWEDTFPLRGRDGTYRWFLSRALPIFDGSGQVLRWFGTNTDITEQQATLLELQQAQADLKQQNQELDSFVYVVSHDLKAPLRGISNLSQWIEDDLEGVLSKEIQQHTLLLRNRIQRMEATIDGLLDYARIGRSDEQDEPVRVAQLLSEVIDQLAPPPTFKIAIAPNLPILHTKRLFLAQVFANLIGNGIKHHDRPDGSIQISCYDRGDVYEFIIADDGPGIAPEYHDRIFTIFQAVNPQNRPDSTGIGLAIVQKIIETEGGTIRLESQVGKGTTFYFTWLKRSPIADGESTSDRASAY